MNLYADARLLSESLHALVGKDEEARARAAADLKSHVELAARELSLERFSKFEVDLHANILVLVNGSGLNEKIGGILAIRELIECTSAAAETKIIKFARALSMALGAASDFFLIELIADAFGHMAKNSPVSHRDYLEGELVRALDWLKGKGTTPRRFAACMILQQLATNAPTIFFVKINEFFDLIWSPLWDPKETIRNVAGKALSACLAVLKERTYHLQWYCFIYDQLQEGFLASTEELVHGSLLVVTEMLRYTGDFMIPRFKEVCRSLMALKDQKSRIVKLAIIDLLPSLANLCPDVFARAHMDESIDFLIKCTRASELRSSALLSIGKMCNAMGPHMVSRMDELLQVLRDIFAAASSKKSSSKGVEIVPGALTCVSDMVQGLGIPFHNRVFSLLEPMLQTGLTAELIATLAVISSHMPSQKQLIQARLLEEATKVLGGNVKPPLLEPEYMYSWGRVGERAARTPMMVLSPNDTRSEAAVTAPSTPGGMRSLPSSSNLPQVPGGLTHSTSFSTMNNSALANNKHASINNKHKSLGNRMSGTMSSAALNNGPVQGSSSAASTTHSSGKMTKAKKAFAFLARHTYGGSSSSSGYGGSKSSQSNANAGIMAMGHGTGLGSEADVDNVQSHSIVILSLKTLASLSIPHFEAILLMQQSVLPYLMSDSYLVRKEAAVTCAQMTANLIKLRFTKGPTAMVIEEILTRLLEVALSDISTQTRLAALKSFTSDFDAHLARSHHVESLMMLLADELFEIRLEALNVLGRLATSNPAAVLPTIRIHLAQIISEMVAMSDYRALEEAASILSRLMKFSRFHFLVRPVMAKVLDVLPLRSDLRATTAALETVGELSMVLQTDLIPYADRLFSIIISNMFDNSSLRKQFIAVKTLGQLVKSTGLVVRPYLQFPQLLPKTLDLLCRATPNHEDAFRQEILRLLGLIGALEPTRFTAIVAFLQAVSKENKQGKANGGFYGEPDEKGDRRFMSLGTLLPINGNSIERDREPKVAFSLLESNTNGANGEGTKKERDRAESNVSMMDKQPVLQTSQQPGDWMRSTERAPGLEDDIIQTDKLLFGDSSDAPSYLYMYEQSFMRSIPEPPQDSVITSKQSPSSEEFYPRVALAALVNVLQDPSLGLYHSTATQTIIQIFATLGVRCVPFLEQIVPYFLQIVRKSTSGLRESVLQQLSQLVSITGQYITPYLPQILEILRDYWHDHLEFVLAIVQQIACTTTDSFDDYLENLLPLILTSLELPRDLSYAAFKADPTESLKALEEVLNSVKFLRVALRPYLHLFVPKLCALLNQLLEFAPQETLSTQLLVIQVVYHLIRASKGAVLEQTNQLTSTLVHTVCKVIMKCSPTASSQTYQVATELHALSMSTLVCLAQQIGRRILMFDSLILRTSERAGVDNLAYRELALSIRTGTFNEYAYLEAADEQIGVPTSTLRVDNSESNLMGMNGNNGRGNNNNNNAVMSNKTNPLGMQGVNSATAHVQKYALNQQQLARSWDVSQRSTANDWGEWLWRFNVDLLRESPIPTLRSCAALAQTYPPMAKELFHAAFYSCWRELSDPYRDSLVRAFQTAFKSPTIPSEILQYLLNLAEFMEHDVEALPINESILAELAQKGHAYAKALHYREIEFVSNPASCFETLININKKLGQYEAASGLLKVATQIQKKLPEFKEFYTVQESWLAKLGYWDEALARYEEKLQEHPRDSRAIAGKMKCLEALGRWEEAVRLCEENVDRMRVEAEQQYPHHALHPGSGNTGNSAGVNTLNVNSNANSGANGLNNNANSKSQTYVKAAVIGARAAWSLNEWHLMDDFVSHLPQDNVDGSFMKAVLAVHAENFPEARRHLEVTRRHLDKMITSLMSESYGRAYMPLIMVQQCSELEEITEYKMFLKEHGLSEDDGVEMVGSITLDKFSLDMDPTISALEDNAGVPKRRNRHVAISSLLGHNSHDERSGSDLSHQQQQQQQSGNVQLVRDESLRRRMFLTEKWRRRIRGCASSGRAAIPYWKYLLNGRRMILSEKEDLDTWLDFVSLCRNGGNTALAERVLTMSHWSAMSPTSNSQTPFGGGDLRREYSNASGFNSVNYSVHSSGGNNFGGSTPNHSNNNAFFAPVTDDSRHIMERRIKFAQLKLQWATGNKVSALEGLDALVKAARPVSTNALNNTAVLGTSVNNSGFDSSYLYCLLKLGEWKISVLDPGQPVDFDTRMEVLALYSKATVVDPNSYRAAHQWALSNYRAVEELKGSFIGRSARRATYASAPPPTMTLSQHQKSKEQLNRFVMHAIQGFMRALCLGNRKYSSSVMQDMLCVLSLWFQHGKSAEINVLLEQGLSQVPLDNWLGVLPQLIARIDHNDKMTRTLLHTLIMRLGAKHPQALVYPLSVALKSPRGDRKEAAEYLMTSLRQHSTKLIDQALLVSQELVRVAILWEEWWHWVLEDASRLCFGDGNLHDMLDMLEPLHDALERGANSLREATFIDTYKAELHQAWECLTMYKRTMADKQLPIPTGHRNPIPGKHTTGPVIDDPYIQQAWELYYTVFKRINSQINLIHSLDLQSTSPALAAANDLDIGVPGTYQVNGFAVKIKCFHPIVAIIRSKQRPRKLRITGEDGQEFVFLLKGHEDLRQDERAMQLFGLVNALLYNDRRTGVNSEDLQIQRYNVMPLSPSVGLIGWVPGCDTLHDLIRTYRDSRKTLLDMEAKLITQAANNQYEKLSVMHKLEVFEHAISFTQGEDLAKILWLKSENSESWLQRRATYTRSLAVMSMVGYILGLGDRHPSNLMLDKKTGKVLHIDFGDCFEVAMHREKFPEKVPFRLTRMLVSAMEVAGIEGNFRTTCEKVMTVLRENRDSLVATLEAFVYDPLISWRLMNIKDKHAGQKRPPATPPAPAATTTAATTTATTAAAGSADVKAHAQAAAAAPSMAPSDVSPYEAVASALAAGSDASDVSPGGHGSRQRSRSISTTNKAGGFVNTLAPIADTDENDDEEDEDEDDTKKKAKKLADECKSPQKLSPLKHSATMSMNLASAAFLAEGDAPEEDDAVIENPFAVPRVQQKKGMMTAQQESQDNLLNFVATSMPLSKSLLTSEIALHLPESVRDASDAASVNNNDKRNSPNKARSGSNPDSTDVAPVEDINTLLSQSQTLLSGFADHSVMRRPSLKSLQHQQQQQMQAMHDVVLPPQSSHNNSSNNLIAQHAQQLQQQQQQQLPPQLQPPTQPLQPPAPKSVSFSQTNLTIDSDNIIRRATANQPIIINPVPVATTTAPLAIINNNNSSGHHVTSPTHHNTGNSSNNNTNNNTSAQSIIIPGQPDPSSAGGLLLPGLPPTLGGPSASHTSSNTAPLPIQTPQPPQLGTLALSSSVIQGSVHMEIAKLAQKMGEKQSSMHQVISASASHRTHASLAHSATSSMMAFSSNNSSANGGNANKGANPNMTLQEQQLTEELTEKAMVVIRRVLDKLNGLDFQQQQVQHPHPQPHPTGSSASSCSVAEQVDRLIQEATSNENLSQSFFGWCPFW